MMAQTPLQWAVTMKSPVLAPLLIVTGDIELPLKHWAKIMLRLELERMKKYFQRKDRNASFDGVMISSGVLGSRKSYHF